MLSESLDKHVSDREKSHEHLLEKSENLVMSLAEKHG